MYIQRRRIHESHGGRKWIVRLTNLKREGGGGKERREKQRTLHRGGEEKEEKRTLGELGELFSEIAGVV